MSDKSSVKTVSGCFLCVWELVVTGPLWLWLVYQILTAIDARSMVWTAYFVYVPAHLLGVMAAGIYQAIGESK